MAKCKALTGSAVKGLTIIWSGHQRRRQALGGLAPKCRLATIVKHTGQESGAEL